MSPRFVTVVHALTAATSQKVQDGNPLLKNVATDRATLEKLIKMLLRGGAEPSGHVLRSRDDLFVGCQPTLDKTINNKLY